MKLARRKKKESSGGDEWLVTYSDLVTLLFAFFVLLYSMSQIDKDKFEKIAEALSKELTGQEYQYEEDDPKQDDKEPEDEEDPGDIEKEYLQNELFEELQAYIRENNLETEIGLESTETYIKIDIKDVVMFDTGQAVLKSGSKNILMELSEFFNKVDNPITIEGHTDNVPISTSKYPSNWELSMDRALSVGTFLMRNTDLNPGRFSLAGFSSYKPIDSNKTAEGRASNRRVSIILMYENE